MSDTIRGKIEDAGDAAKELAKKTGKKVKDVADVVAKKAAKAAESTGQAAQDIGKKLKGKSGA